MLATPGIPNAPAIMQLSRFMGTLKSKKPLIRFAMISSMNPESAFSINLKTSLTGAAAILNSTTQLSAAARARNIMDRVSIYASFHNIE